MNKVRVIQDNNAESPREWDNIGTIAYKHRNYTLGEEEISDPIDWLVDKIGYTEEGVGRIAEKLGVNYYSNEIKNHLEGIFEKKFITLTLYLYDHSEISLSTRSFIGRAQHAEWDSGQVGYIYCSKEKALKEYGGKVVTAKVKQKVLGYMEGEIKIFNQYINGNVYGFIIEDEEENHLDSCYGFYGRDFKTNGILDYIDNSQLGNKSEEEIIAMLEEAEIEY